MEIITLSAPAQVGGHNQDYILAASEDNNLLVEEGILAVQDILLVEEGILLVQDSLAVRILAVVADNSLAELDNSSGIMYN